MPTSDHEGSSNKRLMALGAFASLLVAAAGGALIYGIVLDPAVAGPITGAVGVVVAAILQRRWEKRQELERSRREQMSPIYERLVGILKESPGEEETSEFFKHRDLWPACGKVYSTVSRWENMMERTIGVDRARARLGQLADEIVAEDEAVVLTRRGQAVAVLISPAEYEALLELRRRLAREELQARLAEVRASVASAGLDVSVVDEAIEAARAAA